MFLIFLFLRADWGSSLILTICLFLFQNYIRPVNKEENIKKSLG